MKDVRLYLDYILEAHQSVQQFVQDGQEAFMASELIQSAVIYKLHTLAEASQKIPDEIRQQYPEVEWEKIRGFRNRVVHGYLEINPVIVWGIVENNLPSLKTAVENILRTFEDRDP